MRVVKSFLEEYVQPNEPSSEAVDFIAKWVMAIYGFSIFVWLLCLAFGGIYSNEDVFDSIAEIIKVAVVPVATFVTGYCFARECGREGMKLNATDRSGPSRTWIKVKNPKAPAAAVLRHETDSSQTACIARGLFVPA